MKFNLTSFKREARRQGVKVKSTLTRPQAHFGKEKSGRIWDMDITCGKVHRVAIASVDMQKDKTPFANVYYNTSSKTGSEYKNPRQMIKFIKKIGEC